MAAVLTTEEFWDVNGTPLNTYAYNIASLTGRTGIPGTRGENLEQAYRPGRAFRPKVPDSRVISLAMWVQGSDPEASGGSGADHRAQFQSNLRMLLRLFHSPRSQFRLTKRWTDLEGTHTATALGQVVGGLQPTHTKNRAAVVIDIELADPFFYAPADTTVSVAQGTPTTLVNPGDDTSPTHLKVTLTGPLTKPTLRNTTPSPDIVLGYNGTIAAGQSLVVDVAATRAVLGSEVVNDKLTYSGSIWPMEVFRGTNAFTLSAESGSGTATIAYRPAYL